MPASEARGLSAQDLRRWLSARVRRIGWIPEGMLESTRWHFVALALLSLGATMPGGLTRRTASSAALAVASAVVLGLSWVVGYRQRRASLFMDVVDAAALYAFAVAAVDASAVFGLVFAALWFRSLYGSARAAVLRCGLYVVAVAAVAPTSHHVFGGWRSIGTETLLGVVPIMFVTMIVGRRLAASVVARERTEEFDAVYTSVGYQLLGVTDEAAIRRIAREANERICRVTPGLRVLTLSASPGTPRVVSASGQWSDVPDVVPVDVLEGPEGARGASAWYLRGAAELDGAAGARCRWLCLRLQQVPGEGVEGWVLLGAPGDVPSEAIAAVTSVANHVTLALSNSYVHQELRRQATLDSLTSLANRATFMAALSAALARDNATQTSVLFVDVDTFKVVNDSYGHRAGDDLLREVASRLRRETGPDALCARLGGDEFAVMLRATGAEVASDVAERVRTAVAAPSELFVGTIHVSASVGVATGSTGDDPEWLLQAADAAMYAEKAERGPAAPTA